MCNNSITIPEHINNRALNKMPVLKDGKKVV